MGDKGPALYAPHRGATWGVSSASGRRQQAAPARRRNVCCARRMACERRTAGAETLGVGQSWLRTWGGLPARPHTQSPHERARSTQQERPLLLRCDCAGQVAWLVATAAFHVIALVQFLWDERPIHFEGDAEQLWRCFYRRSGMGKLEFLQVLRRGTWNRRVRSHLGGDGERAIRTRMQQPQGGRDEGRRRATHPPPHPPPTGTGGIAEQAPGRASASPRCPAPASSSRTSSQHRAGHTSAAMNGAPVALC